MNITYTVTGSTISGADCPVCGVKKEMYQEVAPTWLWYMCQKCGYGNYFTFEVDEAGYLHSLKWDRRHERNRFAKFISVKPKHRLPWTASEAFEAGYKRNIEEKKGKKAKKRER